MDHYSVTLTFSRTAKNTAIGKIIVLLIFGILAGYRIALDTAANVEKGKHLTLAQYTGEFEHYKAKLLANQWPWWADLVIFMVMVFVFFGLYELLGWLVGMIIGKIFNHQRPEQKSEDSAGGG